MLTLESCVSNQLEQSPVYFMHTYFIDLIFKALFLAYFHKFNDINGLKCNNQFVKGTATELYKKKRI